MCRQEMRILKAYFSETYSCEEVKANRDKWLKKWREINRSDEVEKSRVDEPYEKFKKEIDDFIKACKGGENES
jgi:hypothetical protein